MSKFYSTLRFTDFPLYSVPNDSFYPDNSILVPLRAARGLAGGVPPRPLSSAEETGPIPKKPRSQNRTQAVPEKEKTKQGLGIETRNKKVQGEVASNIPVAAPPGPRKQLPVREKLTATKVGRNENFAIPPPPLASRRSARLLSNSGIGKKSHNVKASDYGGTLNFILRLSFNSIHLNVREPYMDVQNQQSPRWMRTCMLKETSDRNHLNRMTPNQHAQKNWLDMSGQPRWSKL